MTPELFKEVRRIHFKMDKLVTELLAGAYRSRFKGQGMEFEEVREYSYGDEVRTIDWNVTARMNSPFVKTFREERELTVILLVDISKSTFFGSTKTKRQAMAELGALLAFSAIKNNDKIGLILFSDQIEKYVPPQKGSRHVLRLIRELMIQPTAGKGTDIKKALRYLGKVQPKPAVCFLISDFISPPFAKELRVSETEHDFVAIRMIDPLEENLKPFSLIEFTDLETGEKRFVDTSSKETLDFFRQEKLKKDQFFKEEIYKSGVGHIDLKTNEPFDHPLELFFKKGRK